MDTLGIHNMYKKSRDILNLLYEVMAPCVKYVQYLLDYPKIYIYIGTSRYTIILFFKN